ncbi:hypothetical protein M0D21_20885 [Aquimarina sp. D1M17]|uniref:hypothetical protein n=1 Tax=Aquimarina acroporae TaxID=2937283 RepID=UPI0020BD62C8|nr:hypothetical protein [Aquimarina acroporae]MCK8524046.1 hypothetical protein [Aquimarina acroporae]
MKDQFKKSILSNRSIQEYIYLSYLFLLLVGTLSYSIFYAFLDINIINYSNVLDILLSPIVILTENIKTPLVMGGYIAIILLVFSILRKRIKKSLQKDLSDEKRNKLTKSYNSFKNAMFVIPIAGTLGFYLGYAIAGGMKMSKRIQNGDFEVNRLLEFSNGDSKKVKLIGLNSQYIFYVLENERKISISPISGNLKTVQHIDQ